MRIAPTSPWLVLAVVLTVLAGRAACADSPPSPALFADCRGERTTAPTVILEAGAFGTSADWDYVLDDLALGGRVCAYDRSGLGRSPPRPGGKDALARADELAAVLDQQGESGRVILVGHSNGALYVEAFARSHPDRVAGVVYVNGVGSDALDEPLLLADLAEERRTANLAVTAGRFGLSPLVARRLTGQMDLRGPAADAKHSGLMCLKCLKVARDEDRLILPGLVVVRGMGDADRRIPTVAVIGALRPEEPLAQAWRRAETAPAGRADRSWILDMPGATHVSPLTRDRAYVAAAVAWLRGLPDPDVRH